MPSTFTVSDQRARTALIMSLTEANNFEYFLKRRAQALRDEADIIDAYLAGVIDSAGQRKARPVSPSHEVRSWYEVINNEAAAAEKSGAAES